MSQNNYHLYSNFISINPLLLTYEQLVIQHYESSNYSKLNKLANFKQKIVDICKMVNMLSDIL